VHHIGVLGDIHRLRFIDFLAIFFHFFVCFFIFLVFFFFWFANCAPLSVLFTTNFDLRSSLSIQQWCSVCVVFFMYRFSSPPSLLLKKKKNQKFEKKKSFFFFVCLGVCVFRKVGLNKNTPKNSTSIVAPRSGAGNNENLDDNSGGGARRVPAPMAGAPMAGAPMAGAHFSDQDLSPFERFLLHQLHALHTNDVHTHAAVGAINDTVQQLFDMIANQNQHNQPAPVASRNHSLTVDDLVAMGFEQVGERYFVRFFFFFFFWFPILFPF
jgi:hypothetical protein